MYMRHQSLGKGLFFDRGSSPVGFKSNVKRATTPEPQKFSYPNNQCPPGYRQVGSGSDGPPRGYSAPWGDYVMCVPMTPTAAAPAPAPVTNISPNITVSPAIQTQVSPQISPNFFQAQDSPGATQAAQTTQSSGGQGAETAAPGSTSGSNAALIELMRAQQAAEAQRYERDRQERLAREEQQRQANIAAQKQAEENAAAERAARSEQAAAMQAQYEAALKESQKGQPSIFVSETAPNQQYIPAGSPDPVPAEFAEESSPNWPIIIGVAIVGGGAIYYAMRKK